MPRPHRLSLYLNIFDGAGGTPDWGGVASDLFDEDPVEFEDATKEKAEETGFLEPETFEDIFGEDEKDLGDNKTDPEEDSDPFSTEDDTNKLPETGAANKKDELNKNLEAKKEEQQSAKTNNYPKIEDKFVSNSDDINTMEFMQDSFDFNTQVDEDSLFPVINAENIDWENASYETYDDVRLMSLEAPDKWNQANIELLALKTNEYGTGRFADVYQDKMKEFFTMASDEQLKMLNENPEYAEKATKLWDKVSGKTAMVQSADVWNQFATQAFHAEGEGGTSTIDNGKLGLSLNDSYKFEVPEEINYDTESLLIAQGYLYGNQASEEAKQAMQEYSKLRERMENPPEGINFLSPNPSPEQEQYLKDFENFEKQRVKLEALTSSNEYAQIKEKSYEKLEGTGSINRVQRGEEDLNRAAAEILVEDLGKGVETRSENNQQRIDELEDIENRTNTQEKELERLREEEKNNESFLQQIEDPKIREQAIEKTKEKLAEYEKTDPEKHARLLEAIEENDLESIQDLVPELRAMTLNAMEEVENTRFRESTTKIKKTIYGDVKAAETILGKKVSVKEVAELFGEDPNSEIFQTKYKFDTEELELIQNNEFKYDVEYHKAIDREIYAYKQSSLNYEGRSSSRKELQRKISIFSGHSESINESPLSPGAAPVKDQEVKQIMAQYNVSKNVAEKIAGGDAEAIAEVIKESGNGEALSLELGINEELKTKIAQERLNLDIRENTTLNNAELKLARNSGLAFFNPADTDIFNINFG